METRLSANLNFLSGGGEMGRLIRSFDWESSSLGPLKQWPQSLKTSVSIILQSGYPMFIWWGKDLAMFHNDAYMPVLGKKHPAALGQNARIMWSEIWDQVRPMVESVFNGRQVYVHDLLMYLGRKGFLEETYWTFSYSPILNDEGKVEGLFCACNEETAKILGQRRLKTLRLITGLTTRYKKINEVGAKAIDILADNPMDIPFSILYLYDEKETKLECIRSSGLKDHAPVLKISMEEAAQLWQFEPSKKALEVKYVKLQESFNENIRNSIDPVRTAIVLPLQKSGQDGLSGYLVCGISARLEFGEEYTNYFITTASQIATAISDVRAFEEERKRAEALIEIDRAKTIFFNNISHEFRTPLSLLLGPLEEFMKEDRSSGNENIEIAYRNAQRLLKLVNALLDFSRIEAGRLKPDFENLDLAGFTADISSSFRSAIEKAGLQFIVSCQPLSKPILIDRDMWEKIVLNLLSNALKYTMQGNIEVKMIETDAYVELSVSDTGTGISDGELPKIFDRFHRIKNKYARTQEGTGIGLSFVRELVKIHEGSIDVESTEGKGSTFFIRIPFKRSKVEKPVAEQTHASTSLGALPFTEESLRWLHSKETVVKSSGDTTREMILVVDDNADMRDYIKRLLNSQYIVNTVADGLEALEFIDNHAPDLVISDVMMPGIDGLELVKRIKENPLTAGLPVILLSARAGEEATIDGLQSGADDYLVKPFSSRELLTRVRSAIKINRLRCHAEKQIHNLFEQAPVAIAIFRGPNLIVELANDMILQYWGRTKEQVLHRPIFEELTETVSQGYEALLKSSYESGQRYVSEAQKIEFDRFGKRETIDAKFVLEPFRNEEGGVIGLLLIAHDITDQVTARVKLEKYATVLEEEVEARTADLSLANSELEKSNKELEQFAYAASHDMQEPLRKIQTFASFLTENENQNLNEASKKYISKIQESAKRMSGIIEDLLNYSYHGSDRELQPTDLNRVLEGVLLDLELSINQKNAKVISSGLPVIPAVSAQMHQLFYNLLNNSLKFSKEDVPPVIEISSCLKTDEPTGKAMAEISFRDNGIGFEPEYSEKIFQLFKRLNDRYSYTGSGIGLALCKKIVLNHHGSIVASSEQGKGATFVVRLPYGRNDQMSFN